MTTLFSKFPSIIMIAAPPASGKTHLIKYILYDLFVKKKLSYGIVFCPTSFNQSYDFLESKYVHSQYNENVLTHLINIQIAQIEKNGKALPSFVIWDDCIGSINFQSPLFMKLITTYRHYNMTLIFTTQYIYKLPTTLRECATYFITFNQQQKRSLVAIHETFMGDIDTWNEVREFIQQNTKDYNFIIVNTQETLENKYKFAKAPNVKDFHIKY